MTKKSEIRPSQKWLTLSKILSRVVEKIFYEFSRILHFPVEVRASVTKVRFAREQNWSNWRTWHTFDSDNCDDDDDEGEDDDDDDDEEEEDKEEVEDELLMPIFCLVFKLESIWAFHIFS